MRPFLRFALCAVALGSGGCTFVAEIGGSSVMNGDEHGGTVSHVTTFTIAGATNMAASWCGQYGLYAEETRVIFATDSMDFACVVLPGHSVPLANLDVGSVAGPPAGRRA